MKIYFIIACISFISLYIYAMINEYKDQKQYKLKDESLSKSAVMWLGYCALAAVLWPAILIFGLLIELICLINKLDKKVNN